MRVRAGSGWQTTLADLSLILFMLTASAVTQGQAASPNAPPEPAQADAVSLYKPGNGAPPLGEWLAAQGIDPRQRLTIVVPYAPGRQGEALALAQKMAGGAHAPSRVIIEPGNPADAYAALTFDVFGDVAQGLQSSSDKAPPKAR